MATGRLKTLRFNPAPGTWQFTIASMILTRPLKVMRSNVAHGIILIGPTITPSVSGNKVLFRKVTGLFKFDSTNPFAAGEEVFIIYKDRLI